MVEGWLVAMTKPQQERWARDNVQRQGYDTYLPVTKSLRPAPRSKAPAIECLFPRYLFVKTDGPWRFLTGTFGVSSVICQGSTPALLPDLIVNQIRAQEDERGLIKLQTPDTSRFKPGDRIRINEGLYSGYTGVFELTRPKDRVRVLLDFLGRKCSVELDEAVVEVQNGRA